MDPVGDHAPCCAKLGLCARYDDLCDEFAALCVEVGLVVDVEKGRDNLRPEDVLVHGIEILPWQSTFQWCPLQPLADLAEVPPGKLASQVENQNLPRISSFWMVFLSFRPATQVLAGGDGGRIQNQTTIVLARQLERGFPTVPDSTRPPKNLFWL